jgi:hypothetical protein
MLDPVEERKFADLRSMCRELRLPSLPEIHIGFKVHDKTGILIFDDIQRGHSFTRNFWNYMFSTQADAYSFGDSTYVAGKLSARQVGGTIVGGANNQCARNSFSYNGGGIENAVTGNYGIILGTGTTAFSVNDYKIETKITPGNGANNMLYTSMGVPSPSYNAGSKVWTNELIRIFNNNSGDVITVTETALYHQNYMYGSLSQYCMERTVLAAAVSVANGAQLTVTYTISMDFSAID